MFFSDPDDFRMKNHDFSDPGTNCHLRVIEAVQNVKIAVFSNCLVQIDFSRHFCDFCRLPIEDFPKNHDSEHDFEDQNEVNC